jgi:hypothetical protein
MTNNKTVTMSRELAVNLLHCGVNSSFITPNMTSELRNLLATHSAEPLGVEPVVERQPAVQKYDDTLLPFIALMRKELHSNDAKGDRPGWLAMSADTCLLEIIYHFGKLQASVRRGDEDGICEYAADVANMCMMLTDICGALAYAEITDPPELAELQATIARLTAENDRLEDRSFEMNKNWAEERRLTIAMRAEINQFKDEIERLKGGQGEPVVLLGKGFTTLESCEGKYRIITAYQNRDDAWSDYKALCKASRPAPVSVALPEGYMIVERSIWTEEQAESAAKCITLLKNVPGMTDRDLALAAMDAGQCHAPEITLADLACLDKVKELNR